MTPVIRAFESRPLRPRSFPGASGHWKEYMRAYDEMIRATATEEAPWRRSRRV